MTEPLFPHFYITELLRQQHASLVCHSGLRIVWDLHQLNEPSVQPPWLGDLDKLKPALVGVSIIIF